MKEKLKEQIEIWNTYLEDMEVIKGFLTGEFHDITGYGDKTFDQLISIYQSISQQIKETLSESIEMLGDLTQIEIHELLNK